MLLVSHLYYVMCYTFFFLYFIIPLYSFMKLHLNANELCLYHVYITIEYNDNIQYINVTTKYKQLTALGG